MPYKIRKLELLIVFALIVAALAGCGGKRVKKEDVFLVYPPPPEPPRFYYERTLRTSADVREETASDRFRKLVTGMGSSSFGLLKPYGVAAYQGRIYVSDTVQRAVLMFDIPHKNFKIIGNEGPGALTKPIGLATSRDGLLYVADHSGKRVVVFDKDGNFVKTFGGSEYLIRPSGVAVSPDGATAYVIDTGGVDDQDHHQVTIWDTSTGRYLGQWGKRGTENGEFNLPLQIAVNSRGEVYVVDGGNFRVQAFSADGRFLRSIGSIGRRSGQFSRPKGLGIDPEDNIYVADTAFGNFQIFNPEGQLLLFVGDRGGRGAPGEYMLPAGLTVDEDGRVYMVDQYFKKVDVYRPASIKKNEGWLGKDLSATTKK